MEKGKKYHVGNNTDYRRSSYDTDDYDDAVRLWHMLRPRPDAGNLYSAWFTSTCPTCGEENDEAHGSMSCACSLTRQEG